jgi:hypothetical protein
LTIQQAAAIVAAAEEERREAPRGRRRSISQKQSACLAVMIVALSSDDRQRPFLTIQQAAINVELRRPRKNVARRLPLARAPSLYQCKSSRCLAVMIVFTSMHAHSLDKLVELEQNKHCDDDDAARRCTCGAAPLQEMLACNRSDAGMSLSIQSRHAGKRSDTVLVASELRRRAASSSSQCL